MRQLCRHGLWVQGESLRHQDSCLRCTSCQSQHAYCGCVQEKGYVTADKAESEGLHQLKLSGTKFRQLLRAGEDIPEWFAFKSVVDVLRNASGDNGA